MHVLAAFIIVVSLVVGFYPEKGIPEGEVTLAVSTNIPTKVRGHVKPMSEIETEQMVMQSYDYSCGSAALATLLNYRFGDNFSEREVIQGLLKYGNIDRISKEKSFSLLDMKLFIKKFGYDGNGYKEVTKEELGELDGACIVPIQVYGYRHFTVFKGIYDNHVFLADPFRGRVSYTLNDFMKIWFNNVIFVVSTKDTRQQISALKLDEKDLRYIDEDATLQLLFKDNPSLLARDRIIDDIPGEHQQYKQ